MPIPSKISVLLALASLPALAMDPPIRLPLLPSARPPTSQPARPAGTAKPSAIQRILAQARAGAPVDEGMTHRRLAPAAGIGGAQEDSRGRLASLGGSHRLVQGFGTRAAASSQRPAAGTLSVPSLRTVWGASSQQPVAAPGAGSSPVAAAASSSAWTSPAEGPRATRKAPQPFRYVNTSGDTYTISLELAQGHPPVEALVTWLAETGPSRHTEALLGGEVHLQVSPGPSVAIDLSEGAVGRFRISDGAGAVLSRHRHGSEPAAKAIQAEPDLTLEDLH